MPVNNEQRPYFSAAHLFFKKKHSLCTSVLGEVKLDLVVDSGRDGKHAQDTVALKGV